MPNTNTISASHINAETPGAIHEGGELGYALAVSFGSVMDNPHLITAVVVGDGEAESGPCTASVDLETARLCPQLFCIICFANLQAGVGMVSNTSIPQNQGLSYPFYISMDLRLASGLSMGVWMTENLCPYFLVSATRHESWKAWMILIPI